MTKARPPSPDELELTAYHEAGHAVVAYVNGARIFGVNVWTTKDGVRGQCRSLASDDQTQLLIKLAGVQAESLRVGRNERHHRDNLRTLYVESHGLSDEQALAEAAGKHQRISSENLDALRQQARAALRHDWPAVQAVARALLEGDLQLSAEETTAAIAGSVIRGDPD